MCWKVVGGKKSIEFYTNIWENCGTEALYLLVLVLSDPAQFTSLWEIGGCGNHVVQRVWDPGFQSHLEANTCQNAGSRAGSQCYQNPPSSTSLWVEGGCENHANCTAWFWDSRAHLAVNTYSQDAGPGV
jgi:hypothetical protein